jgi:outer membrane protein assembly factor BamB
LHCKDTNTAWGYSYDTGQYLWGPVSLPGNAWAHISVAGSSAYGNVYIWDYGGNVYALNKDNGTLIWHRQSRSSGYDTPLGLYSLWTYQQSIVDGKLFLAEGDLYNPPLYPCKILVVNATTGELVWDMLFCGPRMNSAHADGMMVWWNSFDNQIYCFGKGQTKTTIEASPKTSVHGSSVLIEGFVTDESAGTKHSELVARFPNGVPAIADESMSPWMEYVYMQQAKPTNTTGVKVTLNVLDSNNNYRTIGTATSNSDGFFKYKWTPDIEGEYTLYASFEGSESYWPSQAVTAFAVDTAITQATEQPVKSESVTDQYFIPAVIAIIIVILVVGAMIMLMLRRRP